MEFNRRYSIRVMSSENAYESIPYASKLHPGRHPRHILTVAALHGVEGTSPERASLLEIGCGSGHALFPLALEFPEAVFRGIDGSAEQIAMGVRRAEQLGLTNVRLEHMDLSQLEDEQEVYDYILCHGVYSWVSRELQAKILKVIGTHLSERGLAYLSYNTLPGWHFRGILRDLLLSEIDSRAEHQDQIKQAREVLSLFGDTSGYEFERPYSLMMHAELKRIASENDAYLFHEYLEKENNPVYLKDLNAALAPNGLSYIADSRMSRNGLNRLFKSSMASHIVERCRKAYESRESQEQFLDFVFHTPFRESILCRQGRTAENVPVEGKLKECFFAACYAPLEGEPDFLSDIEEEFVDLAGQHIFVAPRAAKAALIVISKAWPCGLQFEDLLKSVRELVESKMPRGSLTAERVAGELLEFARKDLVDVSVLDPNVAGVVPERPKASLLAAAEARAGSLVTNLRYQSVEIGEFERELLQLLDGGRTHEEIADCLLLSLAEHGAKLHEDGLPITDPVRQRELVTTLVHDGLETVRKAGLLALERR